MMLPFGILLATIALAPLFFSDWWGRHYPKVACGLAAIVVAYYVLAFHASPRVWSTTREYVSFMALVGSLFVVSGGGIHITVKGEATPLANVGFLAHRRSGIANLLGTTGASMLLIRPWLRMNKYRLTAHHVVFFIFIVSNVGGCLTPVGDPPLFLGYLSGVPFWWTFSHCLPMWLVAVAVLLIMFFVIDFRNFQRAPASVREKETGKAESWRFTGLGNLFFLGIILAATTLNHPPFAREGLMVAAALGSWFATSKQIHESNHFSWGPVKEVAVLFIWNLCHDDAGAGLVQCNAGRIQVAPPRSLLFRLRGAFECPGQCAHLSLLSQGCHWAFRSGVGHEPCHDSDPGAVFGGKSQIERLPALAVSVGSVFLWR